VSTALAGTWRLSRRLLLAIYAIVPIAWVVVIVDLGYLHGGLREILPRSPEELFWFTVFFVLPHILASQFSFYDREYLRVYRGQLRVGVPLVLGGAGLLYLFDAGSAGLIFIAVTMWHVIAQQVGIAGALVGTVSRAFVWWKWLTIAVFTLGVTNLAGPWLNWIGAPLLVLTTLLTVRAAQVAEPTIGRHYLWATQAMSLSAGLFAAGGYFCFAILVPRVVHDVTGWAFYLTHDHNRNLVALHNALYRALAFSHLPIVVVVLALAIGVNVLLDRHLGRAYEPIILAVSLFHYYTESFMWRRHSIHRSYVAFSP